MNFYEVIYEDGTHSVMSGESDKEALDAIREAHRRAVNGLPGGASLSTPHPGGNDPTIPPDRTYPATRVKRVLKYDRHPADYGAAQVVAVEEVQKRFTDALDKVKKGDMVDVPALQAEIWETTYPMLDSGPHESNYKMPEVEELSGWED